MTEPTVTPRRARTYYTLDALRGIAALCIAIRHGGGYVGKMPEVSTYLAVDMFFCLSGFVIAHSYQDRLTNGLSSSAFLLRRIIRLYPLYALGTIIGAIAMLFVIANHPFIEPAVSTASGVGIALVGSLLFLPSMLYFPHYARNQFPLDYPTWSIFFEIIINIWYARFAKTLNDSALVLTASGGLIVAACLAYLNGSLDLGTDAATFIGGLARVFFAFPLGVLLYRMHCRRSHLQSFGAPLIFTVLICAMLLRTSIIPTPVLDLLIVAVVFPWTIFNAAATEPQHRLMQRWYATLGALSYALYVVHVPLLYLIDALRVRAHIAMLRPPLGWLIYLPVICIAYAAHRWYDIPVRARLTSLFRTRFTP